MTRIGPVATMLMMAAAVQMTGCDYFISAEQRIARAEAKVAAADDRGALIELQNAVSSDPKNVRAHLMLADISMRLGDPKAALRELADAKASGAPAADVDERGAKARLALGEFKALLEQLETKQVVLQEPLLSTYRGLALLGMSQAAAAVEAFDAALAADTGFSRARIGKAEALAAQGQAKAGLQELDAVLAANPGDAAALLLKGTLLARQGDFKDAVTNLELARKNAAGQLTAGQQTLAVAALTEAQLAVGDLPGATQSQAELAKRAPSAQLTHLLAARLAMARQDYPAAVAEAQTVVSATPELTSAKMLLGAALLAQGNLNQAETQLAEVVRAAPENMEARKLLARANLQLQRPDIAMQVLSPLQQTDAADPQLDALLGWANLQRGDDTTAISLLERSVAAQPGNAALKLDLATAYITGAQYEKAAQFLQAMPATPGNSRRDTLLVTALAASQGVGAARAQIDRMVAAAPQDVATLNLAASFHARQGNLTEARALLARATAKEPKNVATLLSQARLELALGEPKAASDAVERALAADASNAAARLMKVELAVRAGDMNAAREGLEGIRVADANAVEPRLALARLYLQEKKTRDADAVINELRTRAQNEGPVSAAVGRYYLDAGRFDEALSWFRNAAQKEPANAVFAMNVARAQLALGNNAAARESLQSALAANPNALQLISSMVMLDLREGRRDAALARVAELKKAKPQNAAVAMLDGDVSMSVGAFKEAAQAYALSAKLAPSSAAAVRAFRASKQAGLPDATAPVEAWLQRTPNDVTARMVLAESYASAGKRDQAIAQYELAVKTDQPNPMALNNLAWLYHEKGDQRAAQVGKRAYAAAPNVAAVADTYGWILIQTGDVKQGLPILQKALADSKSQPDIHYHYAAGLAKDGQQDAARRELKTLLDNQANFSSVADARKLLAQLGG